MILDKISDLENEAERAIVINVNTKLVSTLALLSALRYAEMPVLLIDCESTDDSLAHFGKLMERYDFDLVSAPLRPHGNTLDEIFRTVKAEKVLLVDSDLEIKGSAIIKFFKDYIDEPFVFGCGFTNGPSWLTEDAFTGSDLDGALYHERPWIPLTYFKTEPVRNAILEGKTFRDRMVFNDFALISPIAKIRSRLRHVRKLLSKGPVFLRRQYHGLKPSAVYYDTGGLIFDYLRYEKLMFFVSLPEPVHERFVTHFWGVTRNTLNPNDTHGSGGMHKIEEHVRQRLRECYGEEVV